MTELAPRPTHIDTTNGIWEFRLVLPNSNGPKTRFKIEANPTAAIAGIELFVFKIAKIWSVKISMTGSTSGIKIKYRYSS